MDTTDPDHMPQGHRVRGQATWAKAQRDYLGGDSAAQVCDRYGLVESTLRDRARREGWRKADQPDPDPLDEEVEDEAEGAPDCAAMAQDALIRVRRALRRGRAGEAASWMRLHQRLVDRETALAAEAVAREAAEKAAATAAAAAQDPVNLAFSAYLANKKAELLRDLQTDAPIIRPAADPDPFDPPGSHPSHPTFSADGRYALADPSEDETQEETGWEGDP